MRLVVRSISHLLVLSALACGGPPAEAPEPAATPVETGTSSPRILGWCCPTTDQTIMALIARYEATPPAERVPEVAMVGYRHSSGFDTQQQLIVRDSATWATTWTRLLGSHRPRAPLPAVDFSREMLVIASMGTRSSGGYTVGIDSVFVARDTVFFRVREQSPGSRCGTTAALTSPVGLARVERTDRPIGFVISEVVSECP
jgi:hypothetical protein